MALLLRRFLADDSDLRKRYQLAERLADLFNQYQVYRADWLGDWAEGHDRLRTSRGGELELGDESRWQPALWRALLAEVGQEHLAQSRAGVHPRFVARLKELNAPPPGLPRRITVFGISSLPAQVLEALDAMARFSQVMLYVHNPVSTTGVTSSKTRTCCVTSTAASSVNLAWQLSLARLNCTSTPSPC